MAKADTDEIACIAEEFDGFCDDPENEVPGTVGFCSTERKCACWAEADVAGSER